MNIVVLGLSITSSWGNGHATTYRALLRALARRGHEVSFLERDVPWYAPHRDMPAPAFCRASLYGSLEELRDAHGALVAGADAVIVGSYVPEGVEVGRWVLERAGGVVAFYDIDTPVTLEKLRAGDHEYLRPDLIPRYDVYLSFTGGRSLRVLEAEFGSPRARALYCAVDPEVYFPEACPRRWDLGYLGTYSPDRQPSVDALLVRPAAQRASMRFVVAGPQYPDAVAWGPNVERIAHVPPGEHRGFYSAQRLTLNVTRAAMRAMGHAPSVRLFEAAACGVPVVSDVWPGLDELLEPGREFIPARETADVLRALDEPDPVLAAIGRRGRERILASHTADHRAGELERHLAEAARHAAPRGVPA